MVSLEEDPRESADSPSRSGGNMVAQWPATRGPSLEDDEEAAKFQKYVTHPMRMESLEEDPQETPKRSCLEQWPATRGPSLEDEADAAKFSFGADLNTNLSAAIQSAFKRVTEETGLPANPPGLQANPPRWCSIEDDEELPEFMKNLALKEQQETPNTPAAIPPTPKYQWPATRGPSLDEFGGGLNMFSHATGSDPLLQLTPRAAPAGDKIPEISLNDSVAAPAVSSDASPQAKPPSDVSTVASTDASPQGTPLKPPVGNQAGKSPESTIKISLTDTLGLWSIGSAAHEAGTCKPCAFLWKDPKQPSCQNGRECTFCHLCPPGEVKRRKKEKMFMRKMAKNLGYPGQFGTGFESQYLDQFEQFQYQQNQVPPGFGSWNYCQ